MNKQDPITVTELNNELKFVTEPKFAHVCLIGELSNIKVSGKHLYCTLKDCNSSVSLVGWSQAHLAPQFSNGEEVKVHGKLNFWQKNGTYAISINRMESKGTGSGSVHVQYELLKQKYQDLGYFDRKKKLTKPVKTIGIVTALEGAALQDILYVLNSNKFTGKVLIANTVVQGKLAPKSIETNIDMFSHWKNPDGSPLDLILITRGGGSFEDLLGFSSGEVIEAIVRCPIYTISAVGHEVDFMLSDFVADHRAPTPSVAAEIISSYCASSLAQFNKSKQIIFNMLKPSIMSKIMMENKKLEMMGKALNSAHPLTMINKQIVDLAYRRTILEQKFKLAIKQKLNRETRKLDQLGLVLTLNNPLVHIEQSSNLITRIKQNIFEKIKGNIQNKITQTNKLEEQLRTRDIVKMLDDGYAIITKANSIVSSISNIKIGQKLKIKLSDGELQVSVDAIINN